MFSSNITGPIKNDPNIVGYFLVGIHKNNSISTELVVPKANMHFSLGTTLLAVTRAYMENDANLSLRGIRSNDDGKVTGFRGENGVQDGSGEGHPDTQRDVPPDSSGSDA